MRCCGAVASCCAIWSGSTTTMSKADCGNSSPPSPPPGWIARVCARLQEEATPLADLARDEDLHPVYFSRAFARWTGNSPSTLRARARMQRALAAVSAGHSLVDAALQAGFADHAHFSRAARAHSGLCPRQLRTLLA
jgi:AraC family transcriptional regulator